MAHDVGEPEEQAEQHHAPQWAWNAVENLTLKIGEADGESEILAYASEASLAASESERSPVERLALEQVRIRRFRLVCSVGAAGVCLLLALAAARGGSAEPAYAACGAAFLVFVLFVPLRVGEVLPSGCDAFVGAIGAWLLCLALCLAAPSRKHRLMDRAEFAASTWDAEPCEESATAMWQVLVLALLAALLPMPVHVYFILGQVVTAQYLAIGLLLPRPECRSSGSFGLPTGPLLGMPPMWAAAVQLELLVLVISFMQFRFDESRTENLVCRFVQTRDSFRCSLERSPTMDEQVSKQFVLQMGLEKILTEIEREERRWRRFLGRTQASLPRLAASRGWAAVIGIMIEIVSGWREELQSQASNLNKPQDKNALAEKIMELSNEDCSVEAVAQFVTGSLASSHAPINPSPSLILRNGDGGERGKTRQLQRLKTIPGLSTDLKIGEWDFDAAEVESDRHDVLQLVGFELLRSFRFFDRDVLSTFLQTLEAGYVPSNQYHSQVHAADMCNSYYYIVTKSGMWRIGDVPEHQYAAMILAALGHDVGHFAKNNGFLVAIRHDLAITYNDRSVLENFHAATLVKLMGSSKMTEQMDSQQVAKMRHLIIALILATDTQKHLEELSAFRVKLGAEGFDPQTDSADQLQAFCMLFRSADIGHSAKPWRIHQLWSKKVSEEFHQQGDEEKRLGLKVSPLCEREGFKLAASQTGFLQFICLPTWRELARFEDFMERATRSRSSTWNSDNRIPGNRASTQSTKRSSVAASEGASGSRRNSATAILPVAVDTRGTSSIQSGPSERRKRCITQVCLATCEENFQAWKAQAEQDRAQSDAASNRGSRHNTHTSSRHDSSFSNSTTGGNRTGRKDTRTSSSSHSGLMASAQSSMMELEAVEMA